MNVMTEDISGYRYDDARLNRSHGYLVPALVDIMGDLNILPEHRRVFDLGCGNGSVAQFLSEMGWDTTGVDPSLTGIEQAKHHFPALDLKVGSAYNDLQQVYGQYPLVVSLEVVEHVYAPRRYAETLFDLFEPGGTAVISTPYHGYFKNLALALTGQMDRHFTALWDDGHIKFWSVPTLRALLSEAGFDAVSFRFVGRIAPLAKSMIAVAHKK